MTLEGESGAVASAVCPFVAFADDRDLRAATPDHRHRCYAETPAAPRALAHQARYCLDPDFASCPIFQDWASREAAHVSEEPAIAAAAAVPAAGPGFFDELRATAERPSPAPPGRDVEPPSPAPAAVVAPRAASVGPRGAVRDEAGTGDEDEEEAAAAAAVRDWDRPRQRRDYPRLERDRRVSRTLLGIGALAVAALLLFLLPTLLRGFFGGGTQATATPSTSASATESLASGTPSESAPGASPTAAQLTYTVVAGDTLTKIATKFQTTVQAILAANPSITNPNNIKVGQVIVIPTAGTSPSATP